MINLPGERSRSLGIWYSPPARLSATSGKYLSIPGKALSFPFPLDVLTLPGYLCDNDAVIMPRLLPFSRIDFQDQGQKDAVFISLSQFATSFSLNFIAIFLPFYILKVSPYSKRETLLWLGAIIGVQGLFTAITSPIWGSLTHRLSPKKLFQRGQIAHATLFLLMGFTVNLHILFALKLLQGIFGGVSTIGLIILSATSSKENVTSNIGLFQSSQTLGQLIGPPLGTLAAATFGYRGSFLCGSALLFGSFLLCQLKVSDVPKPPRPVKPATRQPFDRRILVGWMVCFMVQIQIIFLPAILPNVLETFQLRGAMALKLAGSVVMFYTIATMIGIFTWTRLVRRIGRFPADYLLARNGHHPAGTSLIYSQCFQFYDYPYAANRVCCRGNSVGHIYFCQSEKRWGCPGIHECVQVLRQLCRADAGHFSSRRLQPQQPLFPDQRPHDHGSHRLQDRVQIRRANIGQIARRQSPAIDHRLIVTNPGIANKNIEIDVLLVFCYKSPERPIVSSLAFS